jgi:arylsulfatase A-like enzyme
MATFATRSAAEKPNIIIILADDLGYSDLGCYGSEIKTPHLDGLAKKGLRYRQFYNTSKCMHTRSSLLTGRYVRANSWIANYNHGPTIGEVLQTVGYRTLWSGKNHSPIRPPERGFHRFYGFQGGACNYWNPGPTLQDGGPFPHIRSHPWMVDDEWLPQYIPEDPNYYMTDAITDNALSWLEEYRGEEKPFFLYLAYNAPHWPLHAKDSDIAKYKGVYDKGYQAIRQARYERMVNEKLIDPITAPLFPEKIQQWEGLSDDQRRLESQRMEIHAAMVDNLDQNIGRVIERLKAHGEFDNTLIMFLADNGASDERDTRAFKNYKPTGDEQMGSVMTYECIGPNWARVVNAPLAKYKATNHEGGVCTPMIAHWPMGIKVPGGHVDTPGHLVDLMSTVIELSGATYPRSFNSKPTKPIEGVSLVPTFSGKPIAERTVPIGYNLGSHKGIRVGKWKLVRLGGKRPWELHDMAVSRTETENLAGSRPEMVTELEEEYNKWEARCRAAPTSEWHARPSESSR